MQKIALKIISLLLIMICFSIMIGWIFHIRSLVQMNPTQAPIMFNTTLCFFLCGIALYIDQRPSVIFRKVQAVLGLIIFLIAFLCLMENLLLINLGINTFFVKSWFNYYSLHVDRMGSNTAFVMLSAALVFMLFPLANKKFAAILIELLIFFIFIIGILGATGYFFNVEFLYSWTSYAYMPLQTSVCFIIVSLGLWLSWWLNPSSTMWYKGHEDKKIIFASSIILCSIALLAGLAGFITAVKQQDQTMGITFQQLLKEKIELILKDINQASFELNSIRNNLIFQNIFRKPFNQENSTALSHQMQLFLEEGFSGVEIFDKNNQSIAKAGSFIQKPEMTAVLTLPGNPLLIWKNGWYLRFNQWINPKLKSLGYLHLEWKLTVIDRLLKKDFHMAKTADILICAPGQAGYANCFPCRLNPKAFQLPRVIDNQSLPMDYALKGQIGNVRTYDYRHHQVLAAFSPLGATGLGIVLKIDMNEIYLSIFKSLQVILPLIFIAILLGILFLRLAVMPLVRKVINTESELLSSNKLLREIQERYDLAVVGSQVGLWDWPVKRDYVFLSPLLKAMLGFTNEELKNSVLAFKALIHPDDLEKVNHAIEEHLERHVPYSIEYRVKKKNGEYIWVQAMGQALWDEQGRPVRMSGSLLDISERKKDQQLQGTIYTITKIMSEALTFEDAMSKVLCTICEGMNWEYGGLWMVDYQANVLRNVSIWTSPSSKLTAFTRMIKKMELKPGIGLPGIVWQMAKPSTIFSSDDIKKFPRMLEVKKAGLKSAFCFPILLGFKVLGVIEFFTHQNRISSDDVIKIMETVGPQIGQFILRKNTENELRESEAYKTAIVESASDSIVTIDDYGVVVSFNAQTEKLFGYTASELKLKNINELMPGLFARVTTMPNNMAIETMGVRHDGENLTVEISISDIMVNNEHRYVAIIRNVTERKKIEALKNEFISIVSHELRTPLTSIRGAIGLIMGGAVGDFSEKGYKLLSIANNNCNRLLLLINDILDLDKIEAGKMFFDLKPVDINEIVKEAIIVNQTYAEKFEVTLRLVKTAPGIKVNIDPDRLMQVLTNLISNAVKFSPKKGQVSIEIYVTNNFVRVKVKDQGQGIPEEFKAKIFQKFSQADSSVTRGKGGTGLGLSISKAIIEKLGGILNFMSEKGSGTVFYFDLPILQDAKKMSNQAHHKSRLLICEDDESQAEYLSTLLKSAGFYTDIAHNAAQAKELLTYQRHDVLLLDLLLPDQDGIALIRELRSNKITKNLPIIVVSVMCEEGKAMLKGDAISIVDWLDKPVDLDKLIATIKSIKLANDNSIPHVLHVEDDQDVRTIVKEILKGIASISTAETIRGAKEKLDVMHFDLVILDLMLPDGNGTELLKLLAQKHLPVVVFSSSELDQSFAKYVSQTLLKSKTTNQKLLDMIQELLNKNIT